MKTTSTWWEILLSGLLLAGTLVAYADARTSDLYSHSRLLSAFQNTVLGTAYSMNPAWRFYKGHIERGGTAGVRRHKDWNIVSLPDGSRTPPYRGKRMQSEILRVKSGIASISLPRKAGKGKQQFLHFEAIMGKSKIWVNGKLLKEHFGGSLPVIARCNFCIEVWRRKCNRCMG